MRHGDAVLSENEEELLEIKQEAEFYGIQGLVEQCQILERTIKEKTLRKETSKKQKWSNTSLRQDKMLNGLASITNEIKEIKEVICFRLNSKQIQYYEVTL